MTPTNRVPSATGTAEADNVTVTPEQVWHDQGRSNRPKRLMTLGATLALSVLVFQLAPNGPTKTRPAAEADNITAPAVSTAASTPTPRPSASTSVSATPKAKPSHRHVKASPPASTSEADSAGDWPSAYRVGRVQTECDSITGCMTTATITFTNMDSVSHTFYYEYQGIDDSGTIVYEGASSTAELDPGRSQKDQMVASDDTDPTNKVARIEVSSVTVDSPF
ncbi:hypothetical protein ACWEN3_38235 [Streptomyces sp. NPDC004561]